MHYNNDLTIWNFPLLLRKMYNFHLSYIDYIRLWNITKMPDLFGNFFFVDTRSSNLDQGLWGTVFSHCLYSLTVFNILRLWQSSINLISGVIFLSLQSEMEQMICQSSHRSSLQQKRTALQQERQSLANILEGEFKSFISWEINGITLSLFFFSHPQETKHTLVVSLNSPALILLSSIWKKTELDAAQCDHRLGLVEIKPFTAVNAHGRHCWRCVATGIS